MPIIAKHLFKPLVRSLIVTNYSTLYSKRILITRPLIIVMNNDRGVADGAEKERPLLSGIASVQVGVGSVGSVGSVVSDDTSGRRKGCADKQWKADQQLMTLLTSMGISAVAAQKALFYTNNTSAELATAWIFENPDADVDTPLDLEVDQQLVREDNVLRGNEVYKMVFIVNSSLEMGVGKIAAQVAHAALGMHQILLQGEAKFGESLIRWSEFGETKIVLKGDSTPHLIELEKKALSLGLPTYLVQDAGKTQVKAGSTTVLCLFGEVEQIDQVSGSLRLL